MQRVTVSVCVRLARVLDLNDGLTRSFLRVLTRRMFDESWREEQLAGREALTRAVGQVSPFRLPIDDDAEGQDLDEEAAA